MARAEHVDEWIRRGHDLTRAGDLAGALAAFDAAIEADGCAARAWHGRGWVHAHRGDLEAEIADWTRAIEVDPRFDEALADRAAARAATRDDAGAVADWEAALVLRPDRAATLEPLLARHRARLARRAHAAVDASPPTPADQAARAAMDRRDFLEAAGAVATTVALSAAVGCGGIRSEPANPGVRWGMVIDLRRCVGCKACTIACKAENHTPPGVAYNVVMEEEVGVYPHVDRRFLPRPCMQCANSSCTEVCPTGATYHRADGIVVVDYDRCIGCRYCIAACPYGARSFDYGENYEPDLSPHERQPSPEYGQHRRRGAGSPVGNVRKCTFCLHRVVNGLNPACAETCIGHAIHFGNLADPEGRCTIHGEGLQDLLARRRSIRLKEELGNEPAVHYLT